MGVTQAVESPYSRILAVEVWNFMSIEHGRVEFDERNIINLKGYNDSGKSAILTALRVALLNTNPSKQASFIQDDKEYFRVVVYFDDGVQLLRDKYINGQSLIEMYKDGQCVFTTKSGKTLTRITDMPQPVADYLGLAVFDGGSLNARSCFEKQLGVQTTGAENYKMFNTVLKSEEIATAGILLNNDKNKLQSDIGAVDQEIQAQKSLLGVGDKITDDMISWLKAHDSSLDTAEEAQAALNHISATYNEANSVVVYPEVGSVDMQQMRVLESISQIVTGLESTQVPPHVLEIDGVQLETLAGIKDVVSQLSSTKVMPSVPSVSDEQIQFLLGISTALSTCHECADSLEEIQHNIDEATEELEHLRVEAENHGSKFVKCPNCGELFDPEMGHAHA